MKSISHRPQTEPSDSSLSVYSKKKSEATVQEPAADARAEKGFWDDRSPSQHMEGAEVSIKEEDLEEEVTVEPMNPATPPATPVEA